MKTIIEYLQHKNIIFKSCQSITPKTLGSRKKMSLFLGVDLKSYYNAVFSIEKKSRILSKEAQSFMALHESLEKHIESKIKKKYILIYAPLCSKAKALLEANGWKVWHHPPQA